jgi:uncharacterized membrane protein YsdA (DUF1294 family)/cold shock CspA family protein
MAKGIIRTYSPEKGFGFIQVSGQKDNVFFHKSALASGESPVPFSAVSFDIRKTPKGLQAENVVVTAPPPAHPYPFFIGAALFVFITIAAALALTTQLSPVISILCGINAASFLLCGLDKGAAGTTSTRVPERVLLGIAAVGGAAGLVTGIKFFRHKRRKSAFVAIAGALLVLQLFLFMYATRIGVISLSLR